MAIVWKSNITIFQTVQGFVERPTLCSLVSTKTGSSGHQSIRIERFRDNNSICCGWDIYTN